jgi:type III restriction enzyme
LRYSATHKQEHNKVYRLDALDAFNQKLVKKIGVRGISVKGQAGASAYLYLQSIEVSADKSPQARVEMEIRQENGIARKLRLLAKGDNLHAKSGELDQYQGYVVADMNANDGTLSFTNGVTLTVGDACGDVTDAVLRRLQIREAIQAHFEKESQLFSKGIKVLTLFFIDEVAKYRQYDGSIEKQGEYAAIFEDEYKAHLNEVLTLQPSEYNEYRGSSPACRAGSRGRHPEPSSRDSDCPKHDCEPRLAAEREIPTAHHTYAEAGGDPIARLRRNGRSRMDL